MFSKPHRVNTYCAVLPPSLVSPFGVGLSRVYAAPSTPDELLAADRIDKAGEFRILVTIALRVMSPAMVSVFLVQFVTIRTNYLLPVLMLANDNLQAITVGIVGWQPQCAIGPSAVPFNLVITSAAVSAVPLVGLFLSPALPAHRPHRPKPEVTGAAGPSATDRSAFVPARYHLRFQIHPTSGAAADAAELARFCAGASVSEVVLLLHAEEFYAGHPDGPERELWFETTRTAMKVLREAGLEVSLNPWVTTGHADRGRVNRLGFTPMVGPDGTVAHAQASFTCPRWRSWITDYYGQFAELEPRVLWLEDDFRYHNHAPLEWGGGFEQPMLDRVAELAGEPVTRESLVAAVTAPGPPHPWRAMLQQVWREAQLEVARMVTAEVAARSGGRSRLGLMSSRIGVASIEGRDWVALFEALAIDCQTLHRPHFAEYTDAPGRELAFSVWMLDQQRALRPDWVASEPEIENWPHTAWSKSDTQTWSELVTAQLAASDALFLNVLPTQAGRAERFPQVAKMLARSRPALDWVAERWSRGGATEGVGLPFRPDTAARARTSRAGHLDDLAADQRPAADFLLHYGVPVTVAGARSAPLRALFGPAAWGFDDYELRTMLAGGLLLDGTAADVLTERGYGEHLGVKVGGLVGRENHDSQSTWPEPYALERVTSDGAVLSVNTQPALARLTAAPGAVVWSEILTARQEPWGVGRCGYANALGGRVAVLAATAPDSLPCDEDGRLLLHSMIRFLEGDAPTLPLVSGGPHLIPQLTVVDGVRRLAIANGSADPAGVDVDLPASVRLAATLLAPLAEPRRIAARADGGRVTVQDDLPHRGWLVLEY